MEWKKIDNKMPKYTWLILGYFTDEEEMAWQIGRLIDGGLEFWDQDDKGGPYAGDSCFPFDANQATHWLSIPFYEPERSKREDSPIKELDGLIKQLCKRLGCNRTVYVREYNKDNYGSAFCRSCFEQMYLTRDRILASGSNAKTALELEQEIFDSFIKYGEMRCSEL
jgi:hypothetical protein